MIIVIFQSYNKQACQMIMFIGQESLNSTLNATDYQNKYLFKWLSKHKTINLFNHAGNYERIFQNMLTKTSIKI